MYATHSTNPNTRLFGAATALAMTGAVGYALLVTTMQPYLVPEEDRMALIPILAPATPVEPVEPLALPDDPIAPPDDIVLPPQPPIQFYVEPEMPLAATGTAPIASTSSPAASAPAAPAITTRPRIRDGERPVYPPPSIRAQEHGLSTLEVCISERGRVTDARLKTSSGFRRLDEAALKWVREARFSPALSGGAPKAICGHEVSYDWRLEDIR
jgi:periplasmic protein TonB